MVVIYNFSIKEGELGIFELNWLVILVISEFSV